MNKSNFAHLRNLSLSALVAIILSSCASSQNVRREVTAAGLFPTQVGLVVTPTLVDLDVKNTKIEYSNTYRTSNTEEVKKLLLADAALANKVDLIVTPQYNIEVISTPEATLCKGTLFGYPATFVNFRKANDSEARSLISNSNNEPNQATKPASEQPINLFKSKK